MATYKHLYKLLALILLANLASATATSIATQLAAALCTIKWIVYGLLPTVALIMFMLAGLAYASGQVFGAETKARAQNWATSLLVGGIVGIVLAILAPAILDIFVRSNPTMAQFASICPP